MSEQEHAPEPQRFFAARQLRLADQTVVVIGGSSGIGLAIARLVRAEGGSVIITGRNRERLAEASAEVGAIASAAFDATDHSELVKFFDHLDGPIDHVFVGAGGPYYELLDDIDLEEAKAAIATPLMLMIGLAQVAPAKMNPGGSLIFMSGTGARRPGAGMSVMGAMIAASTAAAASLAIEIAPARINLIAAGFVDTPLSARLLGDELDERREWLAKTLPVRRVVQASDVAELAVLLMTNSAITGSVYDIDGGQQLLLV